MKKTDKICLYSNEVLTINALSSYLLLLLLINGNRKNIY